MRCEGDQGRKIVLRYVRMLDPDGPAATSLVRRFRLTKTTAHRFDKTARSGAVAFVPSPQTTPAPVVPGACDEGEPEVEPLLTAIEVAEILGVHPNYVWAEAKRGRIPSISIGRNRRFRREDLERWIDENTRRAA
jgi:excisionase family DNA binding protein